MATRRRSIRNPRESTRPGSKLSLNISSSTVPGSVGYGACPGNVGKRRCGEGEFGKKLKAVNRPRSPEQVSSVFERIRGSIVAKPKRRSQQRRSVDNTTPHQQNSRSQEMDSNYLRDPEPGVFEPQELDKSLDIAIIGAGIAGLSAAAGLLRSGHRVEIFERSKFSNEVGAAIHVCPNASRVLRYWGFDFAKAQPVSFAQGRVLTGDGLEVKYMGSYGHWPEKFGAEAYFMHRVDLHNGLKDLALKGGSGYNGARLNLSSEVTDLDPRTGSLTLANGSTSRKDLIVVADGVHSRFVRKVIGHEIPAVATGHSAFRFMIPTKKLLESSILRPIFENAPSGIDICTMGDRRLVWYPCRSGELYNFVGIHPELEDGTYKEEWNVAAPLEGLLETFKYFNSVVVEICRKAEDLKLWKLLFRAPIETWVKDKVVLIGDAAHPMLPHQGQGGGQAIEDGGALGALFSHLRSTDDIPQRLRLFEEVRKNRASSMQMFSNAGQDEASKIEEAARPFVKGPIPKSPEEFHDYNFCHNVLKECMMAMESDGPRNKL